MPRPDIISVDEPLAHHKAEEHGSDIKNCDDHKDDAQRRFFPGSGLAAAHSGNKFAGGGICVGALAVRNGGFGRIPPVGGAAGCGASAVTGGASVVTGAASAVTGTG